MSKLFKKTIEIYNSKKRDIKIIFKNIFSISIIRIFDYLIPLLTIPYIVRIIGVEKYGVIAVSRAFITFFLVFITFGFNFSATKFISSHRYNKKKVSIETFNVILVKLTFAIVSFFIILISIRLVPKFNNENIVYIFTSINLFGEALFPVWLFQGLEKMDYITKITVPIRSFFTLLIFVFVHKQSNYILIPLFYALGPLFSGFISFYIIIKVLKLRDFDFSINHFIRIVKEGFSFFLSRIIWNIVTSIDVIILDFVGGDYFAGIFSAARKIVKQISLLIQPLYSSIYPYFSNTEKRKDEKDIFFFKIIFYLSTFGVLIVSLFTFIFSKEVVLILLGKKFIETIPILKMFLIIPFIYHINAIIGTAILIPNDYEKTFNNSVIIASILHLFLLGILFVLKLINPINLVCLIIITYLMIFAIRFFVAIKNKTLRKWLA